MKHTTPLVLCAALLALAAPGCTMKSLRAAYTQESQVVEPGVLGWWTSEDGSVTLDVSRTGSRYEVAMTLRGDKEDNSDGKSTRLAVALFRAGDATFADASLTDDAWEATGLAKEFTLRTHAVCRVDLAGDTLTVRELKYDAVDKLLRKDESVLDHAHLDDDSVALNAPAKKFLHVLAEHAKDDGFFNDADAARTFKRLPGPDHAHPSVIR